MSSRIMVVMSLLYIKKTYVQTKVTKIKKKR